LLPEALANELPQRADAAAATGPDAPLAPGKWKTLLTVLAVMAVMAATGAIYIWNTESFRRRHDSKEATTADVLGYLPARCNILAVLQVAEMQKHPSTRRLLDEPRSVPFEFLAGKLLQWSGLQLGDIAQIAVGAEVNNTLPQLVILVQTKQPYLPGKVTAALAPAAAVHHRGKLLVRFPLEPTGEGLLWCHSERVLALILCLDAARIDDLDAIAKRPRPGFEGFAAPLRAALEERLPSTSLLWCAGHFEQPSALGDLLALAGQKGPWVEALMHTKTFTAGVQAEENLTLTGYIQARDAAGARKLEALLEKQRWPGAQSYKVAAAPADAKGFEANSVSVQVRGDVATWMEMLQRR
jgi:hypothetical protein